ncbi:unnamed protein product [Phaedon cochleariae]|uniref:Chitin-binding type-2 domain-containing protein n=1 Tax=Phaedon cochleariae TaxID=80249 RepID=A0A9P0GWR6_PHACE|nr:unnamed protein product [Phaedon cochleariae]
MIGVAVVGFLVLLAKELNGGVLPKSGFSCDGRPSGYYADVATGCQVYHMCDGIGRQFSYACPNATLFQQRMLVCDHWYMVDCGAAEGDYDANLLIGQKRPFVEEGSAYARTPRPDLLSAPSNASEYNIIYRTSGQDQNLNVKNLVGAESKDDSSTDEPTYFPPSHWSTGSLPSTSRPPNRKNTPQKNIGRNKAKAIQINAFNRNGNLPLNAPEKQRVNALADFHSPKVNFKSNFKATTPVYPTSIEDTTNNPNDLGLLPPIPYASKKIDTYREEELSLDLLPPVVLDNDRFFSNSPSEGNGNSPTNGVNFPSDFKATTPVYPSKDELTKNLGDNLDGTNFKHTSPAFPNFVDPVRDYSSQEGISPPESRFANIQSKFKATTPQYPTFVESTSPDPNSAGLLPPKQNVPAYFQSQFKATTPQYPTFVELPSPDPISAGLLPPKQNVPDYFQSQFKATTPQYPKSVESTSPNPYDLGVLPPKDVNFVNFESHFKATTPQYPTHVETTSPDPSLLGLLAPIAPNQIPGGQQSANGGFPPKFHQPASLDQEFILDESELQEQPGIRMNNFMKSFNQSQWQDLRKVFRIPEYDFPLDDATRPSYESIVNSFEPKLVKKR